MILSNLEIGMKVKDKWFPENGEGEVISIKGGEVRVKYPVKGIIKYFNANINNLIKI